ncbi:pilin [Gilvimarinus agarilyticus]|uniref:pilin n=1 Tax=Gilvimarinus agarilyticus TaxID=679259 RepID=UPI00059FD8D9|nr:pilin [Gilvimarinus agarilyticus]
MKNNEGFTLIELMIVVAIIGILASVALPAYKDYTIRSQVTEGMSLASAAKSAIAETYINRAVVPLDRAGAGMSAAATDTSGQYVLSVDVVAGEIVVTFGVNANPEIVNNTLVLTAYESADGSLAWQCSSASSGPLPNGVALGGPTQGTLPSRYAPTECRA